MIRGLFSFAEFHYNIRSVLDGTEYRTATIPHLCVPVSVTSNSCRYHCTPIGLIMA